MRKLKNFDKVDVILNNFYYCNNKAIWWRDSSTDKVKARFLQGHWQGRPVIKIMGQLVAFKNCRRVDDVEDILNILRHNNLKNSVDK